jgi:hypothetical protein
MLAAWRRDERGVSLTGASRTTTVEAIVLTQVFAPRLTIVFRVHIREEELLPLRYVANAPNCKGRHPVSGIGGRWQWDRVEGHVGLT